jgi:hypothetical protein
MKISFVLELMTPIRFGFMVGIKWWSDISPVERLNTCDSEDAGRIRDHEGGVHAIARARGIETSRGSSPGGPDRGGDGPGRAAHRH